nr:putative membrane protein-putative a lipopolysaccharide biosynthesis acyltransferase [Kibdelosporangium sp. MJ126-NF4]CTQ90973.1 putative membrane protein-putative a lipopolysaccharide biosynthesis acyltransferase [Kibdelosporangium sp. MJ126-NF4]
MFAVFAVVVEHITHQSQVNHPELGGYLFTLPLQFGASTMLVISAFFVCVTIGRRRWLWNRIARLIPSYLVAVLVTYVVTRIAVTAFDSVAYADGSWLFGVPVSSAPAFVPWYLPTGQDLVGNLFLVQAFGAPDLHWVDASYWTLPLQIMGFTVAALLFPRKWLTVRNAPVWLWSLVIVPIVLRFTVRGEDAPRWVASAFDGLVLNRVHLFGVGIAIWLWSTGRLRGWHLGVYIVAALVAQDAHAYFTDTPSTIAFGVALLVVCAAAGGPDWDIPFVRRLAPTITWLAGITYGVYLTHQQLGFILSRSLLNIGASPFERFAASLALAVLLGWLLTKFVERPVHRLLTQSQAGKLGRSPASPVPSPRPISQANTVGAGPPTSGESLAAVSSQSR